MKMAIQPLMQKIGGGMPITTCGSTFPQFIGAT